MQKNDMVLFYHSGKDKAVVGIAKVVSEAYPEPGQEDRRVAVDIKVEKKVNRIVTLAEIKKNPNLENVALIRNSRLSVMPLTLEEFQTIMDMAEL